MFASQPDGRSHKLATQRKALSGGILGAASDGGAVCNLIRAFRSGVRGDSRSYDPWAVNVLDGNSPTEISHT